MAFAGNCSRHDENTRPDLTAPYSTFPERNDNSWLQKIHFGKRPNLREKSTRKTHRDSMMKAKSCASNPPPSPLQHRSAQKSPGRTDADAGSQILLLLFEFDFFPKTCRYQDDCLSLAICFFGRSYVLMCHFTIFAIRLPTTRYWPAATCTIPQTQNRKPWRTLNRLLPSIQPLEFYKAKVPSRLLIEMPQ